MGVLVVVLLVGLWASILVPDALKARRQSSPLDSVSLFERSMRVLAPTRPFAGRPLPGRHVMILEHPHNITSGSRRTRTVRRRRAVLARLGAAVPVTIGLAALAGGPWVWFAALTTLAFVAYVGLLVEVRAREDEIRRKVRALPVADQVAAHAATADRATADESRAPQPNGTVRVRRYGT